MHVITFTLILPLILTAPIPAAGLYQIDTPVAQVDSSWGTHHSLIGDFIDITSEFPSERYREHWASGYVDFINLMTTRSSREIANGCCDDDLRRWANEYNEWQHDTGGYAWFAPFPEMNGDWTSYGYHPTEFRDAWARMRRFFDESRAVWVWALNNWTAPPYHLSDYMPLDYDVVGLSGYNSCYGAWQSPAQVFDSAIGEVRHISTKPLVFAQVGSTTVNGNRDEWLHQLYAYARQQNVRAVMYFNVDKECDWAVTHDESYRNAIRDDTRYVFPLAP